MSNTYVGWQNAIKTGTLAASSSASGMSIQSLQKDIGASAVAWQTVAGVTAATFTCTLTTVGLFRAFGLFRTNLTSSATVVFKVYSGATLGHESDLS